MIRTIFESINHFIADTIAIPLLKLYKILLSPLLSALGSQCRFYPTCSHYGVDAFKTHGFIKGFLLTFYRVAKCNPLHPGGFDPVPFVGHWKPTEEQISRLQSEA